MDIIETIRYLNSADGPHIPLRAIAPYIGVDQSQLTRYMNGIVPKKATIARMEQGVREMIQEIIEETKWLM